MCLLGASLVSTAFSCLCLLPYRVKADQYETIYLTCQPIGMMLAGDEVVPASGRRATAAGRAGLKNLTDLPAGVPQVSKAVKCLCSCSITFMWQVC